MSRVMRALALAFAAGAAILGLLRFVLLPSLAARLQNGQADWLREAFRTHPYLFLLGVLAVSAILSAPVLLIGLWGVQAGPFRRRAPRR